MRAALALTLVLFAATAARAESPDPPAAGDVALGFRLDDCAFRLHGWFLTPDGFLGFWLDGGRGDRGLTVQGRVQRDGRARNFSLDTTPEASGTLRWWQDPL